MLLRNAEFGGERIWTESVVLFRASFFAADFPCWGKIQEKLNNGIYKTKEMFLADITLMCENCKTFNPPDTIFYKTAHDLHRLCDQEMRRLGLL